MHIIRMQHDALASQAPDAFFRSMKAILWLWRQARKISTFTRFVSAPHTEKRPCGWQGWWCFPAVSSNTHFAVYRGKVCPLQFQPHLALSHEYISSEGNSSPWKKNGALKVTVSFIRWSGWKKILIPAQNITSLAKEKFAHSLFLS